MSFQNLGQLAAEMAMHAIQCHQWHEKQTSLKLIWQLRNSTTADSHALQQVYVYFAPATRHRDFKFGIICDLACLFPSNNDAGCCLG